MKSPTFPICIKRGSVVTKVYRLKRADGRAIYTTSWHAGGRRFTKQFSELKTATEEATLKADQLNAGKVEAAATLTGDDAAILAEARRLCGSTPILTALAEWARARDITQGQVIIAAEAWKARNRGGIENVTVSTALDRFLAQKKKDGLQTAKNHKSHFDGLRAAFGEYHVAGVTEQMLTHYLNQIENPVSRNTHRKRMVTFWRWAQSKKYLPQDIKTEADQTSRAKESALKIGIISAAVFGDLLRFIRKEHPDKLPALLLAGFCGLRRSEIHGQAWSDINLAEGHVHVTKAKEGTPARRLVPLTPAAIEWFMSCPDRTGDVCGGMDIDLVRKAGIAAKFKLPENCFRHAYISHAVSKSGDIPRVSMDAGNSPTIIHKHYRALVTKTEGESWFTIRPT